MGVNVMNGMNIQSIIKQAEKVAMTVDESLREAAFNRTVELLTQQGGFSNTAPNKQNVGVAKVKPNINEESKDEITTLMQIDRTAHPEILEAESVLDRSLHLLKAANNDCQIDELNASQIAKVLTDKFRLRTSHQSVRQALDRAGDKVDRVSKDNVTAYRIMSRGESYLDDGGEKDSKQSNSASSNKTNGKSVRTKEAQKSETTKAQESTSKKRNGRPGPTTLVKDLVAAGFFNAPKIINDIQSEIENSQGYRYKSTDLSPVLVRLLRDKMIVRERNAEGQYEYKSR